MVEIRNGRLGCCTEPGDCRDILSAGARPPLLPATGEERAEGRVVSGPHDGAGTLRPAQLVGRQGQDVDDERRYVDWNPADRLRGIGVDDGATPVGDTRDLPDRLDGPGLVVGKHH